MLYSNTQCKQCSKTQYQVFSDNCYLQCKIRERQQDSYGAPSITDSGSSKFLKWQQMALQHLLTGELTSIRWNYRWHYRWQAQNKQKGLPKTMRRKYALSLSSLSTWTLHKCTGKKPEHIHGRIHPQPLNIKALLPVQKVEVRSCSSRPLFQLPLSAPF